MAATELFEGTVSHHAGALRQAVEKAAANVGALMGWDAHMLRDIGLSHSDVASALTVPISDDPSSRLSAISCERRQATRAQALEVLTLND